MYGDFENWQAATASALRIYDPFAYRATVFERLVPVVPSEALSLAERWPVLWCRNATGDADLVVLRGLSASAEMPDARTQSRTSLPLLLQAFPFRFRDGLRGGEIGMDRSAPMKERDAGSYIVNDRGTLLPGAELKLHALERWGAEIELRDQLTAAVFRHGLVEPVQLPDGLAARHGLPDMFTVIAQPEDALIFGALARDHWQVVAQFLAAQRLSLYTMARLVALAGREAA